MPGGGIGCNEKPPPGPKAIPSGNQMAPIGTISPSFSAPQNRVIEHLATTDSTSNLSIVRGPKPSLVDSRPLRKGTPSREPLTLPQDAVALFEGFKNTFQIGLVVTPGSPPHLGVKTCPASSPEGQYPRRPLPPGQEPALLQQGTGWQSGNRPSELRMEFED